MRGFPGRVGERLTSRAATSTATIGLFCALSAILPLSALGCAQTTCESRCEEAKDCASEPVPSDFDCDAHCEEARQEADLAECTPELEAYEACNTGDVCGPASTACDPELSAFEQCMGVR